MRTTDINRPADILGMSRDHHTDRRDLVDTGIRSVEKAVMTSKPHFTVKSQGQLIPDLPECVFLAVKNRQLHESTLAP